jgi:cytochrome c5
MRSAFLRRLATTVALASLLWPGLAIAQSGERSGKEVVDAQCSKCHLEGKGGAPKIGDRDAWVQRLKKGLDATVREAIRGHGGMPPRGDKADLTDREVRNAILYMYYPGNAPK